MVAVLLVAVGTVVSARDALENNGHLHEDVDVTVAVLLVIVVVQPQQRKRLRLEGTEAFAGTSVQLDCQS